MKRTSISWYEYANQFGRGNLTQQRRVVRISRISTVRGRNWPTIFDVDYVDHGQLGGLHLRYNLPRIQRGRRGGELEKSTLLDAMTEAEHLEANSPVLSISHSSHRSCSDSQLGDALRSVQRKTSVLLRVSNPAQNGLFQRPACFHDGTAPAYAFNAVRRCYSEMKNRQTGSGRGCEINLALTCPLVNRMKTAAAKEETGAELAAERKGVAATGLRRGYTSKIQPSTRLRYH